MGGCRKVPCKLQISQSEKWHILSDFEHSGLLLDFATISWPLGVPLLMLLLRFATYFHDVLAAQRHCSSLRRRREIAPASFLRAITVASCGAAVASPEKTLENYTENDGSSFFLPSPFNLKSPPKICRSIQARGLSEANARSFCCCKISDAERMRLRLPSFCLLVVFMVSCDTPSEGCCH